MSLTDWIILFTELIGTVAFAVSGSLTAIERRLDFFGILVLAIFTAVGGGLIRDLILGNTPPVMFRNPLYVLVALASSVLLILFSPFFLRTHYSKKMNLVMHGINIFDAVGLGVFTLTGMNTAFSMGYDSVFLAVFVGVTTGVGGGVMRDLLAGRTPQLLRRDIYAVAAIAGALSFYLFRLFLPPAGAMLSAAVLIVLIRLTALYRRWNLPVLSPDGKTRGKR